jgi:hypothetical protein
MTGPARKLTVIIAALVGLVLAGAAGAIVRSAVFTITPHRFARLSGTNVYCYSTLSTDKKTTFICALHGSDGKNVPGTYGIVINTTGVSVERWKTWPRYEKVRGYDNPPAPGGH